MKAKEIREMTDVELTAKVRQVRRDIARCLCESAARAKAEVK